MLKGELVTLTEVRREDSEHMYRWINTSETMRFNAPYRPLSWVSHSMWFDNIGKDPSRVIFAIRPKGEDKAIGAVQLIDIHAIHQTAELTIRIGEEDYRGKGMGTEAIKLVIDFAWRDLHLQRVWLRVFGSNERALQTYRKAGFVKEGIMHRAAWIDGRWQDEIVLAWLKPIA